MPMSLKETDMISGLRSAAAQLSGDDGELNMDFSCIARIDAGAMRALEDLARKAEERRVKVVLSGVNVNVYKTLKLARLSRRFSFVN
ncbi:MAG TPA: STAS domain-containing protein [Candidatus Sulfotelmatobacter sp.]|nr:STAS domain-containing protein [Candidatus Sulfotelmatobacter sp.]